MPEDMNKKGDNVISSAGSFGITTAIEAACNQHICGLVSIPSIDSGKILGQDNDRNEMDNIKVELTYSVRQYQGTEALRQKYEMLIAGENVIGSSVPVDSENRPFKAYSPSGDYSLIGAKQKVDGKVRTLFTINQNGYFKGMVFVDNVHGDFCVDSIFGGISWKCDKGIVCYQAEALIKEGKDDERNAKPFKEDQFTDNTQIDEIFRDRSSWGEVLSSRCNPKLFVLNLADISIKELETDKAYSPASPCIDDNGNIYYIGYENAIVKLGLYYCFNRPSAILFHDSITGTNKTILKDKNFSYRSLQLVNNRLYYLKSPIGKSHFAAASFCEFDLNTFTEIELVFDVFAEKIKIDEKSKQFIYWTDVQKSRRIIRIYSLSEKRELIKEQAQINLGDTSYIALDLTQNVLLFKKTAHNLPGELYVCLLLHPAQNLIIKPINLKWPNYCKESNDKTTMALAEWKYQIHDLGEYAQMIICEPSASKMNGGLILIPHGGPNSIYPAEFSIYLANFLMLGFTVACINYTGSIGFGREGVEALEGKIGRLDIDDMMKGLGLCQKLLQDSLTKVFLFGGSHGGYISAMLSGLYPNLFAGVILRNPVIDLCSMSYSSDILDWTFGQMDIQFDLRQPRPASADELVKLYQHSPSSVIDKVIAPTMILLGEKDLRVPPFQGRIWHTWLKARKVTSRLLTFPDAGHSLDTAIAEKHSLLVINQFLTTIMGSTVIEKEEAIRKLVICD